MKYETPELTELATAINAVHSAVLPKNSPPIADGAFPEHVAAYEDFE